MLKEYEINDADHLAEMLTTAEAERKEYFTNARDVFADMAGHHQNKKHNGETSHGAEESHGWRRKTTFSTNILLGCLYMASFLMRYLRLAIELGNYHGVVLGILAVLPLGIAYFYMGELVDLISFEIAATRFNEEVAVEVLEYSYRCAQDAASFRTEFTKWFLDHWKGRSSDDLQLVYDKFADTKSGEIDKVGLRDLLHKVYGKLPADRVDRLWNELNKDLSGGIDLPELQDFLNGRGNHVYDNGPTTKIFDESGKEVTMFQSTNSSDMCLGRFK